MEETKKVYVRIYLVKDSFGNKASATCVEGGDKIQICGLKDKDGEDIYFESEAYHLQPFVEDEGLQYKMIEDIHSFDELWG